MLSNSRETFSQFRLDYYPDAVDPQIRRQPPYHYGADAEHLPPVCRDLHAQRRKSAVHRRDGAGKTFLSACIARTVTDRGYSVVYETSSHLFSKLEQAKFSPSDDTRRGSGPS